MCDPLAVAVSTNSFDAWPSGRKLSVVHLVDSFQLNRLISHITEIFEGGHVFPLFENLSHLREVAGVLPLIEGLIAARPYLNPGHQPGRVLLLASNAAPSRLQLLPIDRSELASAKLVRVRIS